LVLILNTYPVFRYFDFLKNAGRLRRLGLPLADSGSYPASYPVISGAFYPAVKHQDHEADYSAPSNVEVMNAWSYTSTPPYDFVAWYVIKQGDNRQPNKDYSLLGCDTV
jgi:hypothetical protein